MYSLITHEAFILKTIAVMQRGSFVTNLSNETHFVFVEAKDEVQVAWLDHGWIDIKGERGSGIWTVSNFRPLI